VGPLATCIQCHVELADGTAVCPSCRTLQPSRSQGRGQLTPGLQIDRGYGKIVVENKIGSGAMGTVYRAWLFHDPNGPRGHEKPVPLALKQLNARAMVQPELRAFFQNEAEALRILAHPNVVRFHDLFTWSPTLPHGSDFVPGDRSSAMMVPPILAMELVDGDTLEDVIARNVARAQLAGPTAPKGLRFDRAWYYMQQVLGALAAGHALGIVHRDVKPSNILIRRDGIVKLTDYGIAHLVQPRPGFDRAPSPQELAPGTGAYMSPEQVLGRTLDGRSDLYSSGIVLYEAIAGRPPFLPSEKSEFALRMDQVETPPPPLRQLVPYVNPAVEQVFARALAKDPAARFANAIEMGEAFRHAFGIPSTPEWRALGEFAQVAREPAQPERAQKLATLRQIVARSYRTQPMAARPR
jgi:eukaryotic-like serine/threonine-protein kinase